MSRRTEQPIESTAGFFVAMGDEILLLKDQKNVNDGRSVGVYRNKENLISMIPEELKKAALEKTKTMEVIEVRVPNDAIVNPNGKTFGIKPGKKVPIKRMISLEKVLIEIHMSATA